MNKSDQIQEIIEGFAKMQRKISPKVWQNEGLSRAQIGMLYMLHYHKGVSMKQLSEYLGVSKSAITQLLDQLIAKKLVNRQVDAKDRRKAIIHLSPAGLSLVKKLNRQKLEGLRTALDDLSPKEIETLYKIHKKMLINFKEKNA